MSLVDRFIEQILGRSDGPMYLRLFLQPMVAILLAIRAGIQDARRENPAFLQEVITNKTDRRVLLRSAWKDFDKVFFMALGLDLVYQLVVFHKFYPLQAILVATTLAIIPYFLIRGPVSRLMRRCLNKKDSQAHS